MTGILERMLTYPSNSVVAMVIVDGTISLVPTKEDSTDRKDVSTFISTVTKTRLNVFLYSNMHVTDTVNNILLMQYDSCFILYKNKYLEIIYAHKQ